MELEASVVQRIQTMMPRLDEAQRRYYLGAEAMSVGGRCVAAVARAAGVDRRTVEAGMREVRGETEVDRDVAAGTRVRRAGAGAPTMRERDPGAYEDLESLVGGATYGNPENPLRWTSRSLRNLRDAMVERGHSVSHQTVAVMLRELGYSLQQNQKMRQVGRESPDRDAQFQHINDTAKEYMAAGQPVISIDCKKKENIGSFKNAGAEYAPRKEPVEVLDHDFPLPELGKAVPYGIYDVANYEGYVNVGISADTAQFAVNSIREWFHSMGCERFPDMKRLYITCDGGGSNSASSRLWKTELQALADELGIPIEVSHFPPGTSKWNKIEHMMFCQITRNWRGKPLETLEVIVSLIASTRTRTGMCIQAGTDRREYPKGIKVSDEELAAVNLVPDSFCPKWNYTVMPRKSCI